MDPKLLNSFAAVAEAGQLSRAAARLSLSLPSLGRPVQALELKGVPSRAVSYTHLTLPTKRIV